MSSMLETTPQLETFVFEAISSCFPKQIGRHLQGYKNGGWRRKEYNSVWVSLVFKVACEWLSSNFCKKESSIIFEENIKYDFSFVSMNFFNC